MFLYSVSLALAAHKTLGIEMQMSNYPVETFGFTREAKQRARSRFVQLKTKQVCSLSLKFVELDTYILFHVNIEVLILE